MNSPDQVGSQPAAPRPTPLVGPEQAAIRMAQIVAVNIHEESPLTGITEILHLLTENGVARWGGVTAVTPETGALLTLAPTNDLVRIVDAVQYRADEGPCVDATRLQQLVVCDRLEEDDRWPVWAPRAVRAGIGAVLSVPVRYQDHRLGSLNLYRKAGSSYEPRDVSLAELGAAHTAALLAHRHVQQHLRRAVDARTTIGQAQGVLMERYQLTADQAFDTLRRCSQHTNTKLHLIAAEVVRTRRLPGSEAPQAAPAGGPDDLTPRV